MLVFGLVMNISKLGLTCVQVEVHFRPARSFGNLLMLVIYLFNPLGLWWQPNNDGISHGLDTNLYPGFNYYSHDQIENNVAKCKLRESKALFKKS